MNEFPLKNVKHECIDKPVIEWEFVTDDIENGTWRVYYEPLGCFDSCNDDCDTRHGFYFMAIEWGGNYGDDPMWCEDTFADITYHGVAYFDGLRHLYFGSKETDNDGYFYYPDCKTHLAVWESLKLLEEKFCHEK